MTLPAQTRSETDILAQRLAAALRRLMAPRMSTVQFSQDWIAQDTAQAWAQAREALNAYSLYEAEEASRVASR